MSHRKTRLRHASALVIAATAAMGVAGCGGSTPTSDVAVARPTTAQFLTQDQLERGLANAFRTGLRQLAVMQQPPEGAADLGQDLPEGLVSGDRCRAMGARPSGVTDWPWTCTVDWRTAAGSATSTRYRVRLRPNRCFAAAADPALEPVKDTTIHTYAAHPLGELYSLGKGC